MFDRIIKFAGSLKLTVVCLAFAAVLVFLGTLAQVDQGLYNVQVRYFRSLLVYWTPQGSDLRIPFFPGGYLIGGALLLNLVTALAEHLRPGKIKVGLLMAHGGIILLVAGQFGTDLLSVESHMRLIEGEARNYSESSQTTELAVVDTSDKEADLVYPFPEKMLATQSQLRIPELPFGIQVRKYYANSRLGERSGEATNEPPAATQGFGPQVVLKPAPLAVKMDERNMPAAVLELAGPQGSLGTWVVGLAMNEPQEVAVGGRTFTLQLRPTRYYKPFSITLLRFTHDKYPGTQIPRNFSSRVRVQHASTGEDREALIYMNNPLRYGGETFYQSGYDERDPRVSILQVVRNPGWITPYFSCLLVGAGLIIHFMSHLIGFIQPRRNA